MKRIFYVLALCVATTAVFGQGQGKQPPVNSGGCFNEWYSLFKERGAKPVPDGMNDVIITLRNSTYVECFMGRIEVVEGKLSGKLQVQKMDGSYEEFDKRVGVNFQNAEGTLKEELREINNGMSALAMLTDGDYIRLFFYKALADKPKANKKAPSPSSLIKN